MAVRPRSIGNVAGLDLTRITYNLNRTQTQWVWFVVDMFEVTFAHPNKISTEFVTTNYELIKLSITFSFTAISIITLLPMFGINVCRCFYKMYVNTKQK